MRLSSCALGMLLLIVASSCTAQQASDFDGTWVFRFGGQPIFKLALLSAKGGVTGTLTKPSKLTFDQDGDVTNIEPGQVQLPIQIAALTPGRLEMTIDGDEFHMTLENHNRALFATKGMRPLHLERASSAVVLASSLKEPEYPEEIRALRERLRAMVKEDQDARFAFDLVRMEAIDSKNRSEVLAIFDRHGWVTYTLAGKDAAHDFWLLIQHQTPEIQQRLLPALEKAAKSGDASLTDYAYLYDRVQMGLGQPQHWGTQAKCENGKPVLYTEDDPSGLDARRKELFLPPIADYLEMDYLVKSCAAPTTH